MAITTYTELKSAVADFLNRDDLTSVIPTFISLAEADMNRNVRHWRMENRASAEIDSRYSAIPADMIEPIRLHLEGTNYRAIIPTSQLDLQDRRSAGLDVAGKPEYYALTQGEFEMYPTPDATYDMEINYYARIPALSATVDTNWMLTYHPDTYLYGALTHSAPYLKEDPRIQVWMSLYQSTILAINLESERSKTGGSGRRMRIRSY